MGKKMILYINLLKYCGANFTINYSNNKSYGRTLKELSLKKIFM